MTLASVPARRGVPGGAPEVSSLGLPPTARPRYPGEFFLLLAKSHLELFRRLAEQGDVVQVRLGRERIVLVTHPADVERVLVTEQKAFVKGRALGQVKTLLGEGLLTSESAVHLRHRRLLQPLFHRERIAGYASVMVREAARVREGWADGRTLDVHSEMMHLTRDIAAETMFGLEVGEDPGGIEDAIALSLKSYRLAVLPLGPQIVRLPLPVVRRAEAARARLDAWLLEAIRARRAAPGGRHDLLAVLVEARDPEGGGGLTDQEVRDEMVTLLLAGHETTAVALSWTWYLLSCHPNVEAALHAELDAALQGRLPTVADYPSLAYTRMVFAEAMRLFPPAWILERRAVRGVRLGGYLVPAGSLVFASQFLVHRDARWYPYPERFDPKRWRPGAEADRPKLAYFPFGAGTRICIGEHFAWMEGVLLLATLAQRWRLVHAGAGAPALEPLITLRPKGGVPMRAVRR